jgi:cation diffusion facilitator family transporter
MLNIAAGFLSRSTSVTAAGFEFAGDVLASGIVLVGIVAASKPPDAEHPYGHGRLETLAGLLVGMMLVAGGFVICYQSIQRVSEIHPPPPLYALWALAASALIKSALSYAKFRVGRRIGSAALVADAWNDAVDILSAMTAGFAVALARSDPSRFLAADHYGGVAVGLVVVYSGLRVTRDASLQLIDTMPDEALMQRIRAAAMSVPGVRGVEKCFARKTGLQYHVDLHLEVDPDISVRDSHEIATQVRIVINETLDEVADVLVHVEPAP